ncbi:MAG: CotH kinase family protein, partial [Bacteroidota bacterium]
MLRVREFRSGLLPGPVLDAHFLDAPLRINEILAVNTSINPDNIDLGDYSDWIELHNTSSRPLDLAGYHLSDDEQAPLKWSFPDGTLLPGNSMVLVWADDYDAAPGQLVQRDYSPYEVARLIRIHAPFKLSGDGESLLLHSPGGVLLDRVDFGPQMADVSIGRDVDSSGVWLRYGEPTPGGPNTSTGVLGDARAPDVAFSVKGGIYTSPQQLTLSVDQVDAVIRHTTDGTRPTSQSPIPAGVLTIDRSTVIRAASYRAGHLRGKEHVEVYLFETNSTLPIVSLAVYPETLNDPVVGIFAKSFKKREVPVHIDFYESDGLGQFHIDAGMKLVGFNIQRGPQKPLSIELDERWGSEEFSFPLFSDRDYLTFRGFILRPGGNDGSVSFLREGLITTLLRGRMDVDYQAYRPARVYLNGVYHGLYNIREKQDLDYLASNHPGVAGSEIDFLEHDVIGRIVSDGTDEDYGEFVRFMETNDLSTAEGYEMAGSQMDLNEFINFQIASIYIGRASPDHNIKFWKAKPTGRWRWVVVDVDEMWKNIVVGHDTLAYVTSPIGLPRAPLWSTVELRGLLRNESFRNEFIQRFVTHIQTTFAPDRVHSIMDAVKSAIDPEMPFQIARWPTLIPSLEIWEQNVEELRRFTDRRPAFQLDHLKSAFGLEGMSGLTVDFDETRGFVLVHGVVVPPGYAADYFEGIPVRLEAVPLVGYRFAGWGGLEGTMSEEGGEGEEIAFEIDGGVEVTCFFEPDPDVRLLPGVIDGDFTVTGGSSDWVAGGDVVV